MLSNMVDGALAALAVLPIAMVFLFAYGLGNARIARSPVPSMIDKRSGRRD